MGSGRPEWAVSQLVAGQRRGPGLVGRAAALGGVAMATGWLVVVRAQEPTGVAAGELVIVAEPGADIDRGGVERRESAVERTEFGAGGGPLDRAGLHYDGE